jgi:hypothetical protein
MYSLKTTSEACDWVQVGVLFLWAAYAPAPMLYSAFDASLVAHIEAIMGTGPVQHDWPYQQAMNNPFIRTMLQGETRCASEA